MSRFWSWFIILIVVVNIIGGAVLLVILRKNPSKSGESVGHNFDGIEELNNPLPRWWMWIFWISIIFSVGYLFLYPGLGNFKGFLGWTSKGQLVAEEKQADAKYGPIFAQYYAAPIEELAKQPQALKVGKSLFANNCATCHGADAHGAVGFPNLADDDWLFGGSPQEIETSILKGRNGVMPPMGAAIGGDEGIKEVTAYVRSLNNQKVDQELVAAGQQKFNMICSACHGVDAKGNKFLGAPNLTNNVWLFGGSEEAIMKTIKNGRNSKMPAHEKLLGKEKVHLLAAYIYSLSMNKGTEQTEKPP